MNLQKKLAWAFLVFIVSLATLFVCINFQDEEPNEDIKSMLNMNYQQVPFEFVEAYKLMLGLRAPFDKDYIEWGGSKYNSFSTKEKVTPYREDEIRYEFKSPYCNKPLCSQGEIQKMAEKKSNDFNALKILTDRYMQIIRKGGIASDLKPSIITQSFSATDFLLAQRMMELNWSQLVYAGKFQQPIEQALAVRNFFVNSLKYPQSLLFVMISINIIKNSTDFILAVKSDFVHAQKVLTKIPEMSKKVFLSYEQIRDNSVHLEVVTIIDALNSIKKLDDLTLVSLEEKENEKSVIKWFKSHSAWLMDLIYKPQETANIFYANLKKHSLDPCIPSENKCGKNIYRPSLFSYFR
ncbi:MAG: hypothetical protein KDD40_10810, partial [Bdellovibrionales bacterium]|nr:hypothetical protein [Bdellovibrionales bacterium]